MLEKLVAIIQKAALEVEALTKDLNEAEKQKLLKELLQKALETLNEKTP